LLYNAIINNILRVINPERNVLWVEKKRILLCVKFIKT
jgi:hypothetical protein